MAGIDVASDRSEDSSASISEAVPSTVFSTPAHAVSQSIAALVTAPRPAAANPPAIVKPRPSMEMVTLCFDTPSSALPTLPDTLPAKVFAAAPACWKPATTCCTPSRARIVATRRAMHAS